MLTQDFLTPVLQTSVETLLLQKQTDAPSNGSHSSHNANKVRANISMKLTDHFYQPSSVFYIIT